MEDGEHAEEGDKLGCQRDGRFRPLLLPPILLFFSLILIFVIAAHKLKRLENLEDHFPRVAQPCDGFEASLRAGQAGEIVYQVPSYLLGEFRIL